MKAGICVSTSRAVAIAFAAVVNLVSASASEATVWVGNLGMDNASCRPQQSPCRSISHAIENAADGDTIKVGPGHYGNVSGNSNYGGLGDERPQIVSDGGCVVCITKALRIYSVGGLFADNEASGNAGAGFKMTVGEFFGGPITLQGNLARGAGKRTAWKGRRAS